MKEKKRNGMKLSELERNIALLSKSATPETKAALDAILEDATKLFAK